MTTLLVAGGQRCARRCYDAAEPVCTCICGGRNHGVGRERAVAQTPGLVDATGPAAVAVLELPLTTGPTCVGCGRPETPDPRRRRRQRYLTGYWCPGCHVARLTSEAG